MQRKGLYDGAQLKLMIMLAFN